MTETKNIPYEDYLEICVANLDKEASLLTNENEFLRSLLDAFWTGNVPDNATLDHMVLAKAGRLRLAEKAKVCALLGGNS